MTTRAVTNTPADYLQRIREVYPDLPIDLTTVHLRRGQFNEVLIVNDELIFRFPRTDETLHRLASQLAAFLRTLHGIPTADLGLTLPIADDVNAWTGLYHASRDELFPFLRSDARDHVAETFESFLTEPRHFTYQPVPRHGDFGGSNILFKRQTHTISGVIDFSSAARGDPAVDLAAVSSYGDRFLEYLLAGYPDLATPAIRERARFYQSTHALQQALWAHRTGDQADFEDGIAAYV